MSFSITLIFILRLVLDQLIFVKRSLSFSGIDNEIIDEIEITISFYSNTGGRAITQLAERNHLSSIEREDYDILEFQEILTTASSNEQGKK